MKMECNKIAGYLLLAGVLLIAGCKKQRSLLEQPGTIIHPVSELMRRFPPLPRIPLQLARCVYTYQDVLNALGNNTVNVRAVMLSNGVTVYPDADLNYITYEATPDTQANSLFGSRLVVEWRWPGGNWQLSTADVWSLGCVYEQAGVPPYTNLIKDGHAILINTCFYWSTNQFTGERVDYLIVD